MELFNTFKLAFVTGAGYVGSFVFTAKVLELLGVFELRYERFRPEEEDNEEDNIGSSIYKVNDEDMYKSIFNKL